MEEAWEGGLCQKVEHSMDHVSFSASAGPIEELRLLPGPPSCLRAGFTGDESQSPTERGPD